MLLWKHNILDNNVSLVYAITYIYIHVRVYIYIYCTPCVVSFIRLVWLVIIIMYYVWTWLIVFGFAALGYRRAYIYIYICVQGYIGVLMSNSTHKYIYIHVCEKAFCGVKCVLFRGGLAWCTTQHNTSNGESLF